MEFLPVAYSFADLRKSAKEVKFRRIVPRYNALKHF